MIFRNLTARIVLDLRGPSVETKKSFVSRLDDVFKERVIDHVKRMGYCPYSVYISEWNKSLFLSSPNYNHDDNTYFGLHICGHNRTNPSCGIFVVGRNQREISLSPFPTNSIKTSLIACDLLLA